MNKLFFDIETIPCADGDKARFLEVLKKKRGNQETDEEELFTKMSFDGAFGRICCIGYIKETNGRVVAEGVLDGEEREMLTKFWEIAKDVQQFIGHNIYEFDLPFVYKRSLINTVKPRDNISFARYRNIPIYDTMREWDLWGDSRRAVSLDLLSNVFGLQTSKDEMDGSQVWPYYKEGRIDEIKKYCMKDVVLTREVYYKMICEKMPEANTQSDIPF